MTSLTEFFRSISADPFLFYRSILFVVLTVYTIAVTVGTAVVVARLLRGDDPRHKLLRTYLSYTLVTVRLRPALGEIVQIGIWSMVLVWLWWLHWQL